jgi:membrane peptidoglycan carboxypeptidase
MAEDGAIDVATASAAIGQPIRLAERKHKENASDSQEGWFQDLAWKQALAGLPNDLQSRQDIVVRTTLRPDLQTAANTALKARAVAGELVRSGAGSSRRQLRLLARGR